MPLGLPIPSTGAAPRSAPRGGTSVAQTAAAQAVARPSAAPTGASAGGPIGGGMAGEAARNNTNPTPVTTGAGASAVAGRPGYWGYGSAAANSNANAAASNAAGNPYPGPAAPDPYIQYAAAQGNQVFADQNAQNQYLADQFNTYTNGMYQLNMGDAWGNYYNNAAGLQNSMNQNQINLFQNNANAGFNDQGLANTNAYIANQQSLNQGAWQNAQQQANAQYGFNDRQGQLDLAHTNALYGFNNQQLGLDKSHYNAGLGFNQRDLDEASKYNGQLSDFAARQFGLSKDTNQFQFDQTGRQVLSDNSARGAVGSRGFGEDNADNARNLDLGNQGATLTYDQSNASIADRQSAAQLGYERGNEGLTNAWGGQQLQYARGNEGIGNQSASNTLSYDRNRNSIGQGQWNAQQQYMQNNAGLTNSQNNANLSHDKQASDIGFSNDAIDSLAKEYGVNATQLNSAFKRGMDRLGLNYQQAQDQLAEAQRTGNAQAMQAYMQIYQQALAYAG